MKNYTNPPISTLITLAIQHEAATLTNQGMISVNTGKHTGRAAKDKYIVFDSLTEHTVDWSTNNKMDQSTFDSLYEKINAELTVSDRLFDVPLQAGLGQDTVKFTFYSSSAWHTLFAKTMFYPSKFEDSEWQMVHHPGCLADPAVDNTRSETFIAISFSRKIVIIGGTAYAGEIKKSIFTVLNYLLPDKNVLPMHAAVNSELPQYSDGEVSDDHKEAKNTSVFFGLSGTGKTTLSSAEEDYKILIGDDEHGWRDDGTIFNFENGCYAKTINLHPGKEWRIYNAIHNFGTVLENVPIINGMCDFNSSDITENTRAAYKLQNISNASDARYAGDVKNIFMLTCDAYGVLPLLSKLTPAQAAYYFLSGYTAKIAGTEADVKEPVATFSACFGAPFLPRHPSVYAKMLMERIEKHNCNVWLLNTGWFGGPLGIGERADLRLTRALIKDVEKSYRYCSSSSNPKYFKTHNVFNLEYLACFTSVLRANIDAEDAWVANGLTNYQEKARELAAKFKENFKKFELYVATEVRNAGPIG